MFILLRFRRALLACCSLDFEVSAQVCKPICTSFSGCVECVSGSFGDFLGVLVISCLVWLFSGCYGWFSEYMALSGRLGDIPMIFWLFRKIFQFFWLFRGALDTVIRRPEPSQRRVVDGDRGCNGGHCATGAMDTVVRGTEPSQRPVVDGDRGPGCSGLRKLSGCSSAGRCKVRTYDKR